MVVAETQSGPFLGRLQFIYGTDQAPQIHRAIENLITRYEGGIAAQPGGWSEADALLITYADSIIGPDRPLRELHRFLKDRTGGLLSLVHLLPFYPSTSDDGFSVVDFREVRPDLGAWEDIEKMAADFRLVFDGVINHVSASSGYMKGFCSGDPALENFFLALDPETDTRSVLRTRNLPLLHDYATHEGTKWLWTTFSRDQVDLNYANPRVLLEVLDVLLFYAQRGASMIRLDAIPYLWKELGTSCAHRPQTHELIRLIRDVLDRAAPQVLLLTETNVPHRENVSYFGNRGDEAQMIYNFTLAPLIVWSLYKGDARVLSQWASGLEYVGENATYLNITATHDGIGMRPTEGILTEGERAELVQLACERGGDMTGKRNGDGSVSPYELNLSYFDAINDPRAPEPLDVQVARFMVSQAIPMSLMGLPGIYIHSLLGSRNDLEGVRKTGRARSINRRQLDSGELGRELADGNSLRAKVFTAYGRYLQVRSGESAFHPQASQEVLDLGPGLFAVQRANGATGRRVLALHNVTDGRREVILPWAGRELLTDRDFSSGPATLEPYQVLWLAGNS
jgi:sucrose phosphorylase